MNVTAVVPARDEERNIVDCLESLAWADRQVVFMDSRPSTGLRNWPKRSGSK